MNPEANYCDYCGTSFRESGFQAEIKREQAAAESKTPATGGQVPMVWFLGVMCLPFVPAIGAFAYLGVLFYWSFSKDLPWRKICLRMIIATTLRITSAITWA